MLRPSLPDSASVDILAPMTPRLRSWLELVAIAAVFVTLVIAVDPRGDFPLNDDWDFAKAAWAFAETGEFQFTGYTAASIRLQVLWGALWTRLFGQSYEVLRASTLFLAFATLVVLWGLLLRLGVPRGTRLLGVGALLAHPIWFWSAFTYMTQVPAIFMTLIALGAWTVALRRDDVNASVVGALASIGSYFIRQTGVVNSVAALTLFLFYRDRISRRWRLHAAISAAPLVLFAILFVTTDVLGGSGGEFRRHYKFLFEETLSALGYAGVLFNYTLFNWIDAGLFYLPLSALAAGVLVRTSSWKRMMLAAAAVVFLARAIYLIALGLPMPFYSKLLRSDVFATNVFVNFGLGPRTLSDTWGMGASYPFGISHGWRVALTLTAALAGAAALAWCLSALRARDAEGASGSLIPRYLAIHLIVANCAIAASYFYTDRYGMDAHWPLVILFAITLPAGSRSHWAAAFILVLLLVFSAASVNEYLSWNRARWKAIAWLEARGAAPAEIDAGVEYRMQTIARVGEPPIYDRVRNPRYRVTFNPVPSYRPVHRFPFDRPLGLPQGQILVSVREDLPESEGPTAPRDGPGQLDSATSATGST